MRIIKRYSNRKLYDTESKRYVTLDEISRLVREGADVKVLDNETEEDLTTVTLSQILHEKERKHKDSLPKSFFTNVIQSGTKIKDAIWDRADRVLGPGVGSALKSLRLPTRVEFDRLTRIVEKLEARISLLEGKKPKAKAKAKAKKKRKSR